MVPDKYKVFKDLISSVWVLGLIIAVPVILVIPDIFNKYKADLILQETAPRPYDYRIFFHDLDGNGVKQKIYAFPNTARQLAIQYFGDDGGMINQINFRHKFTVNAPYIFFGDANNNGKVEIYGFTLKQDSLFLNWTELDNIYTNSSQCLFISRIGTFDNGKIDFSISRFVVTDLDVDENQEIVFSIVAGYSKFPRMLVVLHPDTGEMIQSKDIGINPYFVGFYDLDKDGRIDILAGSTAGFNLNDSTGTQILDNKPFLVAYNSKLDPVFPPVPFTSGINNTLNLFISKDNLNDIIAFQFNRSRPTEKMIGVYRVDFSGNVKDSVFLPEYGKRFAFQVFPVADEFWLYTGDKIVMLDSRMQTIGIKNIKVSIRMYRSTVRAKGYPEYGSLDLLFEKVCVYTEDFDYYVEKKFPEETVKGIVLGTEKGPDHFLVQTDSNEYTYRMQRNILYYLKFPIFLVIYLLSVAFVWLVQNIREKQLQEKFELKNQLKALEIKYLRMQMDPHFMFNAFTTMALMIKNGDRNEAFDSFMKFTRMLRSNFDFSDFLTRPLNEELQTVRDYLEINKLRFKDKLNFEITVEEDVPLNNLIPKMMLQIHVENSLKHGLSQLEKPGFIHVGVYKDGEFIGLFVEDNGIGRPKAASLNRPSTKQGIKMLQALMDRLNHQNKLRVSQTYTDLTDEQGNPAGTRVDIRVPLSLKEKTDII